MICNYILPVIGCEATGYGVVCTLCSPCSTCYSGVDSPLHESSLFLPSDMSMCLFGVSLNDIFEKVLQRDVDPRHLLRLGSGEAELREALARPHPTQQQYDLHGQVDVARKGSGEEFSKQGRVNWSLARRIQLLGQVR